MPLKHRLVTVLPVAGGFSRVPNRLSGDGWHLHKYLVKARDQVGDQWDA